MKPMLTCFVRLGTLAFVFLALAVGCSSPAGKAPPGVSVDDPTLEERIQTALVGDSSLQGSNIRVHALNGVVGLTGLVPTEAIRERAGMVASATPGVVQV